MYSYSKIDKRPFRYASFIFLSGALKYDWFESNCDSAVVLSGYCAQIQPLSIHFAQTILSFNADIVVVKFILALVKYPDDPKHGVIYLKSDAIPFVELNKAST